MSTFPGSPRLLKGAIVGVRPPDPVPTIVVFQYNPESLTRRLSPQTAGGGGAQGEALRLKGPPEETITASIVIDATDQLERGDPVTSRSGVHATLAALELLLYPPATLTIANEVLARFGIVETIPPEAPLVLFVWGGTRVLPVRLNELSITEEAFDPALNPILARVSLTMRVLTYRDLGLLNPGGALFMAHQVAKEVLGRIGTARSLAPAGSPALGPGLGG